MEFVRPLSLIVIATLFAFIFPIWLGWNCVQSRISSSGRILSTLVIILLYPFASYFYGLFLSGKNLFRLISLVFFITFIGVIVYLQTEVQRELKRSKKIIIPIEKQLSDIHQNSISWDYSEKVNQIIKGVNLIKNEAQAEAWEKGKEKIAMII